MSRLLPKLAQEHRLQGHTDVQGLRVAIENRAGSVREGTTEDGHHWQTKMRLRKPELPAQTAYNDLARVPGLHLDPNYSPTLGSEVGIFSQVPFLKPGGSMPTEVDLESDLTLDMGEVDIPPPHGAVEHQVNTQQVELLLETRLHVRDWLGSLASPGDILIPAVRSVSARAHEKSCYSEPLLDRGSGAPQLHSYFSCTQARRVETEHFDRCDG